LLGVSTAVTELNPAADDDPLALRWLRMLTGHPWRSAGAMTLLIWSLAARPRPGGPPSTV